MGITKQYSSRATRRNTCNLPQNGWHVRPLGYWGRVTDRKLRQYRACGWRVQGSTEKDTEAFVKKQAEKLTEFSDDVSEQAQGSEKQ